MILPSTADPSAIILANQSSVVLVTNETLFVNKQESNYNNSFGRGCVGTVVYSESNNTAHDMAAMAHRDITTLRFNLVGEHAKDSAHAYRWPLSLMIFGLSLILLVMIISVLLPRKMQDVLFTACCLSNSENFNYIDIALYKTRHSMYRKEVYFQSMRHPVSNSHRLQQRPQQRLQKNVTMVKASSWPEHKRNVQPSSMLPVVYHCSNYATAQGSPVTRIALLNSPIQTWEAKSVEPDFEKISKSDQAQSCEYQLTKAECKEYRKTENRVQNEDRVSYSSEP
ncbi:unnamed protein product [Protopolystoma xenopodis]|uniref:Uncharacterized protein n=1 Tax=Protopolystoma xenopodis TaxID=117903 RepID=A0A448X0L5_9PLAT|nr:unnamed protein product [Protopolystoma xenopodis]